MTQEQNDPQDNQPVPEAEQAEEQTGSNAKSGREDSLTKKITKPLTQAGIRNLVGKLPRASKLVFQAALIFIVALFIFSSVKNIVFPSSGPIIEAFQIPEQLEMTGLTGEVFATKLLDRTIKRQQELNSPERFAKKENEDNQTETDFQRFLGLELAISNVDIFQAMNVTRGDDLEETRNIQIPVPGIDISLDALVMTVLDALGLKKQRSRIGGEITLNDGAAWLSMRISGKPVMTFQAADTSDGIDIENLLDQGADHILETLYPLAVGLSYARSDPARLELLTNQFWQNNPTKKEKTHGLILEGLQSLVVNENCEQSLSWLDLASENDRDDWLPHYFSASILPTCLPVTVAKVAPVSTAPKFLTLDPDAAKQAREVAEKEAKDKAKKEFEIVIAKADETADMQMLWGQFLYQLGERKQAEEKFKNALRLSSDSARVYINWREALNDLAKKDGEKPEQFQRPLDNPLEKYQEAGIWRPEDVKSFNIWGNVLLESKESDTASALEKYKEAINRQQIQAYVKRVEDLIAGEDISFSEFEEFSEATLSFMRSDPDLLEKYPVLKDLQDLHFNFAVTVFEGAWEGAGKNATILENGGTWEIVSGWNWTGGRPVVLEFHPENSPFEPKAYFGGRDKNGATLRLFDPLKIVGDDYSIWTKYQPEDLDGRWDAKGKTVQVTVNDDLTAIFDLGEFDLPQIEGTIMPGALNKVQFSEGPITSAELTNFGVMRVELRDKTHGALEEVPREEFSGNSPNTVKEMLRAALRARLSNIPEEQTPDDPNSIPQEWVNTDVLWSFEGTWGSRGEGEATICVTGKALTVHVKGFNDGTGDFGPGDPDAGARQRADIVFLGFNNGQRVTANLRTPDLIYWDKLNRYWQRINKTCSIPGK